MRQRGSARGGARWGAVHLGPDKKGALRLATLAGAPREALAPWSRLAMTDSLPLTDAVSGRSLVRVRDREDVARRYPQLALAFPYPFAMAAVPIRAGGEVRGVLTLVWPGSVPPRGDGEEDATLLAAADRLGRLLFQAEQSGYPVLPGPDPYPEPAGAVVMPGTPAGAAAVAFADRLPGCSAALDLFRRFTFVTAGAGAVLGAEPSELVGREVWAALPWLDHPAFEDRFRAAVIGGEVTSFTAMRPPDRLLAFHLYPDATGVSLRVVEGAVSPYGSGQLPPPSPAEPGRVSAQYHLMRAAATLAEAVDGGDVMRRVADRIMPAFGYRALALVTADEGRLNIAESRGYPESVRKRFESLPLTVNSPAGRAVLTGEPSFFASFTELRAAHPGIVRRDGMESWAFLPLLTRARPVGVLVLAHQRPHLYEPAERAVLISLAGLIAQALDRAQQYDVKHELARGLQATLLPNTLPRVPGLEVAARYVPSTRGADIGGDFYDLVRLGEGQAAAIIGDVQGHGMDAAAVMGQVRTAAHVVAGAWPGEVLARTNRLVDELDTDLFTSCLYARVDITGDRLQLASAGHPPPLLRHPGGRTEMTAPPPGLLLGVDRGASYSAVEREFPPGAVLVLYTDGLVEERGVDIDHAVGDLAEVLMKAGDDVEAIADELVAHARRQAARVDDMALLVVRRTRPGD